MFKMKCLLSCFILLSFCLCGFAQNQTWRGSNFSGIFQSENLLKEWPATGPVKLVQIDGVGTGWGSAVLAHNKVFVIGKNDSLDMLSCWNLKGERLWQQSIGLSWNKSFPDSRSTPTLEGERIYATSGRGQMNCFDISDGKLIWKVNVDSLYQADWHIWGVAETPLIVEDKIFSVPAGDQTAMVALDKVTGELIWKSESIGNKRSYVSPVLFQYKNLNQIVAFTTRQVFAVDMETGNVQWKYGFSARISELTGEKESDYINANSPIIKDNQIFVSQGYNTMSVMLEVAEDGKSVKELWVDRTLDCHHHGVVEIDNYIYGSNWYGNRDGRWVCLDWKTGEVRYVTKWNNKGVSVSADGMLYLYSENPGMVGLAKPDKDGLEIISSFEVDFGSGQHWAHPFIAEGLLLIRHGESIGIYNIAVTSPK